MKKQFTAVALAISLALTVAACGSTSSSGGGGSSSDGTIEIGGVVSTASDPYYVTLMCGATKEAENLGAKMNWKASNSIQISAEQANFQAMLLEKPDGVLIATFEPGAFSGQTKTLMQQGTPVVAVDGEIEPPTERQFFYSGSNLGEFSKLITEEVGGTGSFGILAAEPGAEWAVARYKPVVEALEKSAPGIKVLSPQYDEVDRNKAASISSAMILANPDLKAILAVTGPEGEGAAAAVQQAGKAGQIKVYAVDATPGEIRALKAGTIDALLSQPASQIGAEGVKAVVKYLEENPDGGPVEQLKEVNTALPDKVLTKENVNDPALADYVYKTTCN